jgi:hypothetical protein
MVNFEFTVTVLIISYHNINKANISLHEVTKIFLFLEQTIVVDEVNI